MSKKDFRPTQTPESPNKFRRALDRLGVAQTAAYPLGLAKDGKTGRSRRLVSGLSLYVNAGSEPNPDIEQCPPTDADEPQQCRRLREEKGPEAFPAAHIAVPGW